MSAFTANEYILYTHLMDRDIMLDPALSFCSHWLYSKIINRQRQNKIPLMLESVFNIALAGLVKKR